MILKIIGIILLVILGLLLTAVLLILFVPVQYRADVSFDGKPDGEAAVSWLFHLVRIRVSYHEHADVSGRGLWFKLFDMRLWPPEDETEEQEFEPESSKNEVTVQEPVFTETVNREDVPEPVVEAVKPGPEQDVETNVSTVQADSKDDEELVVHATELSSELDEAQKNEAEDTSRGIDIGTVQEEAQAGNPSENMMPADVSEESVNERSDELSENEEHSEKAKIRLSVKIKEKLYWLIKKLRMLFDKLRGLPEKIQKVIDGISKKKISLEKTWNAISMFWHDEQNQKAFHLVWKRTKKLVRYVLPRKLQGRIHFGFDDPYDTGQVLTAVSPFYGLYAKTLTLEPDFTDTALDGELHFKGRIAVWYPLWTAARLFISKDFRRLLRFLRKRDAKTKEK